MKVKQVLVIRKDLNMRKGKMVAQGAHASLKIILDMLYGVGNVFTDKPNGRWCYELMLPPGSTGDEMQEWIEKKFTKICVSVNSEEELKEVYEKALLQSLPASIIEDCGDTEFDKPTFTCCAIGPADEEKINPITGHLPLL